MRCDGLRLDEWLGRRRFRARARFQDRQSGDGLSCARSCRRECGSGVVGASSGTGSPFIERIPADMHALTTANLSRLDRVSTPSYDRSALKAGIVHFGVGNFHRSHEAMYLDRLMQSGQASEWAICGVGLMPQDTVMRDVMAAQDCLFTLVLRHPEGGLESQVIGSMVEYLFGPDEPEAVFARLVDPGVRIVSLTVTEGGYLKHAVTGDFDASHPSVIRDLEHLHDPSTAFGYIVEGLRRRRELGLQPFTVLSCDNLQGNGEYARGAVIGFARQVDAALAEWIDREVSFPNCMVDRITPATTDADRTAVQESCSVVDQWPVPAEPFTQWIIEDDFPAGRPQLESVGVQFVEDVKPYELMKLRLLNASHQALAYLGAPLGYVLVDEAMRDDLIRDYLRSYMAKEAAPTLGELPGVDVDAYMDTLLERFGNPRMRDTLVRLATDGSTRMATFTLPTVRANLDATGPLCWALRWSRPGPSSGRTSVTGTCLPLECLTTSGPM